MTNDTLYFTPQLPCLLVETFRYVYFWEEKGTGKEMGSGYCVYVCVCVYNFSMFCCIYVFEGKFCDKFKVR